MPNIRSSDKPGFNNNLIVLLVCVSIAIVFWVLTILNQPHSGSIIVHLAFEGLPASSVFSKKPPASVRVSLKARGWDLLAFRMEPTSAAVVLNLDELENPNYMPEDELIEQIGKVLPMDAAILKISPTHLDLKFEKMAEKRVPVKADLKLSFSKQYNLNGPILLEPDSVLLVGASSVLDSISEWSTIGLTLPDLESSIRRDIPLMAAGNLSVELSHTLVSVTIPVEEFTEASVNVPIDILNLPEGYSVVLIPAMVKMKYFVALSDFEKTDPALFKVSVNFSNTVAGKMIPVGIDLAPGFVKNLRIEPEIVEYIIHK